MNRLPRRVTLVEQVTESLRRDLREGRWRDRFPGEHDLSAQLQVSRSTLRLALEALRREGLIQGAQGRRTRVSARVGRMKRPASHIIGAVSSQPLHRQSALAILVVDELRRRLHQAGFELQFHAVPQTVRRVGAGRLEALVRETGAAGWILFSCSAEIQRWFARQPVPTLVHGSCHEGVDLPAFRLDAAAAAVHAFQALRRHGHRRFGLLLPESPYAGTLEIRESLRRASARVGEPGGGLAIRSHAGGAAEIRRALGALLGARPAPTALIVMMPLDALAVYCQLLESGFALPRDLSLVSIFDDLALAQGLPALARYTYEHLTFSRRLARWVIRMASSGTRPPSVSIFPQFVPGSTIGPAPQ